MSKENHISELEITVPSDSIKLTAKKTNSEKLQRTDDWFKMRSGKFTGSEFKKLMSCAPGKSRLDWDNIERIFAFGEMALKSIYANAKERDTGKYIDQGKGTYQMQYGTKVEPLIERFLKKKFKSTYKLKEVGFKSFECFDNAGTSADGLLINKSDNAIAAVLELKACTSWDTHYSRSAEFNEKHQDFWQVQGEMLSWGVNTCYYVFAEPPRDITEYLFHDGDIKDLYKKFVKECPITVVQVDASALHQKALLKRLAIAETTLNEYLKGGHPLSVCQETSVKYYNENQTELNKYFNDKPIQAPGEVSE
jgi:hypothetical protein